MSDISLTAVKQKLEALLRERNELRERLSGVEDKIAAFQTVIRECGGVINTSSQNGSWDTDEMQGMSLEEALVAYAQRHGGELNSYHARPALMSAGLLKGEPRAISSRLYEALVYSDRFVGGEKRGRWLLIPQSDEDETEPDAAPC